VDTRDNTNDENDNMTTLAMAGYSIPLEILVNIMEGCLEYDHTKHATRRDYVNYASTRREYDEPMDEARMTWPITSEAAKEDICNLRLVCKDFQSAARESFVAVLQDRRFRLTEGGMADLGAICTDSELAPRIKALAFGSAHIAGDRYRPAVHEYIYHDLSSIKDVRERSRRKMLAGTIERAYQDGREFNADIPLVRTLKGFTNLEAIRVVVVDRPRYLHGWLSPEQLSFLWSQYKTYPGDGYFAPNMFYACDAHTTSMHITKALAGLGKNGAAVKIDDIRFSIGVPCFNNFEDRSPLPNLPIALRKLRITISSGFFFPDSDDRDGVRQPLFLRILKRLTNLQDLALTIDEDFQSYLV
jgi:hypothetical protein